MYHDDSFDDFFDDSDAPGANDDYGDGDTAIMVLYVRLVRNLEWFPPSFMTYTLPALMSTDDAFEWAGENLPGWEVIFFSEGNPDSAVFEDDVSFPL